LQTDNQQTNIDVVGECTCMAWWSHKLQRWASHIEEGKKDGVRRCRQQLRWRSVSHRR